MTLSGVLHSKHLSHTVVCIVGSGCVWRVSHAMCMVGRYVFFIVRMRTRKNSILWYHGFIIINEITQSSCGFL